MKNRKTHTHTFFFRCLVSSADLVTHRPRWPTILPWSGWQLGHSVACIASKGKKNLPLWNANTQRVKPSPTWANQITATIQSALRNLRPIKRIGVTWPHQSDLPKKEPQTQLFVNILNQSLRRPLGAVAPSYPTNVYHYRNTILMK